MSNLDETTNGDPICEIGGECGFAVTMLLYSDRVKGNGEDSDPKEDHYVCADCCEEAHARGWHFVR